MICEKCRKEITHIEIDIFNRDGSDSFYHHKFEEYDNAVSIDTDPNWCGYELSEEEMLDTIRCPHCGKFPFNNKEIQVYDVARVVCFKDSRIQ